MTLSYSIAIVRMIEKNVIVLKLRSSNLADRPVLFDIKSWFS